MTDIVNKSVLSFPVMFEKTEEVGTGDDRFTKVKIWLMHTGQNYNGCSFDKSVIETAISTLGYIPIVGFIQGSGDDKDFTGHKYIITRDEKGLRRKYIGNAYGVVFSNEDNNAHFEMRMCDDGVEREFLVVDGIIWNMFEDSSEIINRDLIKGHSVEIWEDSVEGYEDENGVFVYTAFSFRAACILGDKVDPAMQNSTIEVQFAVTDFVKEIQDELNNKYTAFTKLASGNNQGGNDMLNPNTDFAQTVMEQFNDISAMVCNHEKMLDRWHDEVARFSLVDIQDNEVIVVDRKNNYQHYGFPFVMNGDKAEIDFSCGKRKKTQYVDYEEGMPEVPEGAFDFGKHIETVEETCFAKVTEAEGKVSEANANLETVQGELATEKENFSKVNAELEELKPKYEEFARADAERKEKELDEAKIAQFARFEDKLSDMPEFAELKERKSEFTVEQIEEKCSVMFARKNLSTDFSKKNENPAIGLTDEGLSSGREGYVHTKYGWIKVN